MSIPYLSDQNFASETSAGLVLVEFTAPFCGPSEMLAPVLEEIDAELGEMVRVVRVDVDEYQATASSFEVMSIPALFVLKDGRIVDQALGYKPKEALVELVSKHF